MSTEGPLVGSDAIVSKFVVVRTDLGQNHLHPEQIDGIEPIPPEKSSNQTNESYSHYDLNN